MGWITRAREKAKEDNGSIETEDDHGDLGAGQVWRFRLTRVVCFSPIIRRTSFSNGLSCSCEWLERTGFAVRVCG